MSVIELINPTGTGRLSNRQRLLDTVRTIGPIGRSELAGKLGISVQAASNITEELLKAELLCAAGKVEGARGLPVLLYDLNPDGGFSLGFEIRPNTLYTTLTDLKGNTRAQIRHELTDAPPQAVIDTMRMQLDEFSSTMPTENRMIGAGVVMPGPFGKTGLPTSDTALSGWSLTGLEAQIQDALGMPTSIDNDASAGAAAEHQVGCAKDVANFAYLYFGTGLGLGIISNHSVITGAFGNAGEIGHLKLPKLDGVLEQHLSRSSVDHHLSKHGIAPQNTDQLASLYEKQSKPLTNWINQACTALRSTTELIENLFDPATIVLGGAMPHSVLQALCDSVTLPERTVSNRSDRTHPRLQVGACGAFTVSVGAAALMRNRFFASS